MAEVGLAGGAGQYEPSVGQETDWSDWLLEHFFKYFSRNGRGVPFAFFHSEFWEWLWNIEEDSKPKPFIAVWAREFGKSTHAEISVVALGARRLRRYGLYVSSTQDKADDHVGNVAGILESSSLEAADPLLCQRRIGRYGQSKGWRRNRLRTMSGLTVDALGLDSAARGAKIDEARPDFIVLDDIDQDGDTELLVQKRINQLTRKILPAGSHNVAILGVQNLVHANSIFARMVDGRADFLKDRHISGPHPALKDLSYKKDPMGKVTLTSGKPTWTGFTLKRAQEIIDRIGLTSFLAEFQHDKASQQGAFFADIWHESIHVIDPFVIPSNWHIDRSFDWGEAKPFSVGWWAESNGDQAPNGRTYPKGTLFRIAEWYGWNGKPNEGCRMPARLVAKTILEMEARMGLKGRVRPGPADTNLWDGDPKISKATEMSAVGVRWRHIVKKKDSRINGARLFRDRLKESLVWPMEGPGLFIFRPCAHFIRTIPILPIDLSDPDDVNSNAEDHPYDETRYRMQYPRAPSKPRKNVGMF